MPMTSAHSTSGSVVGRIVGTNVVSSDGGLVTYRLRFGKKISALVHDVHGMQATELDPNAESSDRCSCSSPDTPCAHIRAVRRAWQRDPTTFFALERFLDVLATLSHRRLLDIFTLLARRDPSILGALGVPEFEDLDDELY